MTIQITDSSTSTSNGTTYTTYVLATEKKSIYLMIVTGARPYVNVVVNNASHQAYRGMGKEFATLQAAEANYKCPQIKAMIRSMA